MNDPEPADSQRPTEPAPPISSPYPDTEPELLAAPEHEPWSNEETPFR